MSQWVEGEVTSRFTKENSACVSAVYYERDVRFRLSMPIATHQSQCPVQKHIHIL